jgi:hypothetical protein
MPGIRFGGALLATVLLAAPLAGQAKCAEAMKTPPVGGWAEYQMKEGTMRMALLGEEQHDGKAMHRLELSIRGKNEAIMQVVVPGWPYQPDGVYEMVFKAGGQPAMKVSGQMMSMMRQNMKMPTNAVNEACERMENLGSESVTVPAGTFRTTHYRDPKNGVDAWVDPALPFGLVKTVSKDGEMLLVGTGTGAKSQITETPVEMPGMGGMPKK